MRVCAVSNDRSNYLLDFISLFFIYGHWSVKALKILDAGHICMQYALIQSLAIWIIITH